MAKLPSALTISVAQGKSAEGTASPTKYLSTLPHPPARNTIIQLVILYHLENILPLTCSLVWSLVPERDPSFPWRLSPKFFAATALGSTENYSKTGFAVGGAFTIYGSSV
jgi:hypothetical protein